MSNIVASVVVSKWEKAVDEETLNYELTTGYKHTEEILEHGGDILDDEAVEQVSDADADADADGRQAKVVAAN
jgi:hypothetical protein